MAERLAALLAHARHAGLTVEVVDDRIVISGPRSAEAVARMLLRRETEIVSFLTHPTPITSWAVPGTLGCLSGNPHLAWLSMRREGRLQCGYRTETQPAPPVPEHDLSIPLFDRCRACTGMEWWVPTSFTRAICRRCHPPAVESLGMLLVD